MKNPASQLQIAIKIKINASDFPSLDTAPTRDRLNICKPSSLSAKIQTRTLMEGRSMMRGRMPYSPRTSSTATPLDLLPLSIKFFHYLPMDCWAVLPLGRLTRNVEWRF